MSFVQNVYVVNTTEEKRVMLESARIAFDFRTEYEKIKKSTSSGETVFRDCTEIVNKGEARYQLELVESRQWTLTEGFAAAVCRLPVKYRTGDEYYQFLDTWGTVIIIIIIFIS